MRIATEVLVEKYKDHLFAAAFNVCKNAADADDVVQDTFLQYHTTNRQFENEQHIRAWLIRVAINKAKNINLSFWRQKGVPLEEYMETLTFETPEAQTLFTEVMKLPEKYRIVIHLFYYEDYTIREIAKIMNVTESNVKVRLTRGRRLLRNVLKEEWKMTDKERYKQAFSSLHASGHISLEVNMNHNRKFHPTRKLIAASACAVLLLGGSSAYAAYHFLSPSQIADEVADNGALSRAFAGEDAVSVNETQQSNGYDITLLGLVSGEKLELCVPQETRENVSKSHTYAAVAIAKSDGTDMEYRNFFVAPLINGVSVLDANAATMDETLTWFCKDGVLYELIECDDLEIFADRGVQLGIVDSFGSETAAFRMDNESGSYRKVEDYAGTIALFTLPLDTTKADPAAAEEYLKKLEEAAAGAEAADTEGTAGRAEVSVITGAESKAAAGYMNQQVRDFVDGITADNLSDYFEIVKDYPVFSATPDENGWVDFGTQYIEKEDYVANGGSGEVSNWLAEDEYFSVNAITMSGNDGKEDASTLRISVVFRNEDGSLTEALYQIKPDCVDLIK